MAVSILKDLENFAARYITEDEGDASRPLVVVDVFATDDDAFVNIVNDRIVKQALRVFAEFVVRNRAAWARVAELMPRRVFSFRVFVERWDEEDREFPADVNDPTSVMAKSKIFMDGH